MTDEIDNTLALLNKKSSITPLVGTYVSGDLTGFIVDVGNGRIPAVPVTAYLPEVNEPIWVWIVDGTPYVLGPTRPKPGQGTVVGTAGGLVSLTTAFGDVRVPYNSSLSPSVGQTMKIIWQGGGFAVAIMSTNPAAPVPPTAPGSGVANHIDTFTAIDGGTYESGRWWTPRVYASSSTLGLWFYGTKISDSLPAGAVISKVEIYISPVQIQGSDPNFALHGYATKPGGAPGVSGSTPTPIAGGWVTLPNSFGNALKAGGGSAGVGFNHGGYNIMHSLSEDGQSGAIRITSTY